MQIDGRAGGIAAFRPAIATRLESIVPSFFSHHVRAVDNAGEGVLRELPIERLRDVVKDQICNTVYKALDDIETAITEALRPCFEALLPARKLVGDGWMHVEANASPNCIVPIRFEGGITTLAPTPDWAFPHGCKPC